MPINYVPGTSVTDKAEYTLGKVSIPAATVTRLLDKVEGKSGASLDRLFYQSLMKYGEFLEALEKADIAPAKAIEVFRSLKPVKMPVGDRASRMEKLAEVLAPKICQRFAGEEPETIIDAFLAAVAKPEFKIEALDVIKSHKASFGMSPTGHIKTSGRKANPKALKALAAYRKGKKQ